MTLEGKRILIVEDEFLVALALEEALQGVGCVTLGPAANVKQAIETASKSDIDGAILDVNLSGEMVFPVAEWLIMNGKPFIFTTGYSKNDLPIRFHKHRILPKPFNIKALANALEESLPP